MNIKTNFLKSGMTLILFMAIILSGCSKVEDDIPEQPQTNSNNGYTITISDGYGVLAAVRSVSLTTVGGYTVPVEVNTAVAAFTSSSGSGTFIDAGTVTLNSKSLTKATNNSYYYQNLMDPLNFSSITWNVSGAGSVPAISYTDDRPIPQYTDFSALPSTLKRNAGLSIVLGSTITNADSVYVLVTDYNGKTVLRRMGGNASQCVFSGSDLSALSAGQGMIQVVPWNYKTEDYSDRKYYFIIESAYTRQGVTIN